MSLHFVQGDPTWTKLRHRSLTDLYWFASVVLGYGDKFPLLESTHRLPLLFADRKTGIPALDTAPYQLLLWPRETGKSTCVTVARSIRDALRDPNTAILIANEKQETAQDFIAAIKFQFESNDLLRALFPEVLPANWNDVTWSATRASLKRTTGRPEPTFDSIGTGGTVTGKHYNQILCDDLISREAMENARAGNWTIMERANRWVNQLPPLLSNAAKPFPTITVIGTRWWENDVYDHIVQAFGHGEDPTVHRLRVRCSTGEVVTREATRAGNLAAMRIAVKEEGRLIFPAIWPQDRIDEVMMTDPEFGACNLWNEPSHAAVRTFRDEWLHYWKLADPQTLVYDAGDHRAHVALKDLFKTITVDPAAAADGSVTGCRNAIVVLGTDLSTGTHFVLDVHADRSDPKDLITDIVNVAHQWGVHQVHIELAGQQVYIQQWVEKTARDRGYPLHVESLKPGGRNKDLRIGGLVIPFKNGELFVHVAQSALIADEYRKYRPGAKDRDVLDALAYAMEVAPKPLSGKRAGSAQDRLKAELTSFHTRFRSRFQKTL